MVDEMIEGAALGSDPSKCHWFLLNSWCSQVCSLGEDEEF